MDIFNLGLEDLGLDDPETAALVENARQLNERVDEIAAAGLLTKDQAQRLIEEHAVPLNTDRYPLASFTVVPSRTNLQPALESGHNGLSDRLRALLDRAVELFRKVMAWIRDRIVDVAQHLNGDKDTRKRVAAAAPGIRNVFSKRVEMIGRIVAPGQATGPAYIEPQEAYVRRLNAAQENFNGYHQQIVEQGPLAGALFWLSSAEGQILQAVEERLKLFNNTVNHLSRTPDSAQAQAELAELSRPFAPAWLKQGLRNLDLGDAESFGEIVAAVKRQYDDARSQTGQLPEIEELATSVTRLGAKFSADVSWSAQRITSTVSKLEAQAGQLFTSLRKVEGENRLTVTLAQAQLNEISKALSQLITMYIGNRRALNQISNTLAGQLRALLKMINSLNNDSVTSNERTREALTAYAKEISNVYAIVQGTDDTPIISD